MPELAGDLLVARRPHQRALELDDRPLDLAGTRAHRARHPVERAQLVDDRALDAQDRVRLELDLPVRVVALDRPDQAEQAVGDQILLVDMRRQAGAQTTGDELDERCVGQDQAVAHTAITRCAVLVP